MPLTTSIAIVGMVDMMFPPFGMLVGKWMAIESAIATPAVLFLFIIGSALTVFFWAKWLGRITTASFHESYKVESAGVWQQTVLVALVAAVIAGSLAAMPIYHYVIKPISLAAFGALTGDASLLILLDSVEAFMSWPIFVVIGVVFVAAVISTLCFRRTQLRLPYLCGENAVGEDSSFSFRSVADRAENALVNSYYLSPIFGERNISAWCNPVAALIIVTLFGVILPGL
jgi:ech hydrogenase subunit A